ncbi:SDR family oxidoreductase [Vulgatibacter sp.]|uniref:SDR family oxidoreductase n=1 Tax=Vulgatibacter sp. TaxID=1971226 RepID=UPI0035621AAC
MHESPFRPDFLQGQVALVTGGGTGIGKACALALAAHGAAVVLASRNEEKLAAVAAEIHARGGEALALPCDIKDPGQVESMAEAAWAWRGGVDLLLNNAGANFLAPALAISANGWRAVVDVVLNGTFYVSRAIGSRMVDRGRGRIVMMAATNGENGSPLMAHSGAAKAGVINLAQTLAVEWAASGVTVNAVCPGPVATEGANQRLWADPATMERIGKRVPLGRFATPDDCVGPVLFLASEAASFVTGASLVVDGGDRLRNPAALFEAL